MVSDTVCSVEKCCGPVRARGMCNKHWKRWSRYGDPEGGNRYKGEANTFYANEVLTYEGDECLIWPYCRDQKGYPRMTFDGKWQRLGRIICAEVDGEPPTPDHEACHSCGNGHLGCVTKRHHRWGTHRDNISDKFLHGTNMPGEEAPSAKLTEPEVRAIKRLAGRLSQREIGLAFNVHQNTVSNILTGKTWRVVSE